MTGTRFIVNATYDSSEPMTLPQKAVLERAVAKVILLGEQGGVTTDQMILLLNSGLTVEELLDYLAMRAAESAASLVVACWDRNSA